MTKNSRVEHRRHAIDKATHRERFSITNKPNKSMKTRFELKRLLASVGRTDALRQR